MEISLEVRKPRIPEYFDIVFLSETRLRITTPVTSFMLEGESVRLLRKLLPYFKGDLTIEEIRDLSGVPADTLASIVERLRHRQLLFDEQRTDYRGLMPALVRRYQQEAAFFARKTGYLERYAPIRRLRDSSIILVGLGPVGLHLLKSLLGTGVGELKIIDHERVHHADLASTLYSERDVGRLRTEAAIDGIDQGAHRSTVHAYPVEVQRVEWVDVLQGVDVVILCSDRRATLDHRLLNRVCLQNSRNWISARLEGDFGEVGPLVIPQKSACFACYELRMESNIGGLEQSPAPESPGVGTSEGCGALPPFAQLIAAYVSLEVIRLITGYEQPMTVGGVLSIDLSRYRNKLNRVFRVPDCPACASR